MASLKVVWLEYLIPASMKIIDLILFRPIWPDDQTNAGVGDWRDSNG